MRGAVASVALVIGVLVSSSPRAMAEPKARVVLPALACPELAAPVQLPLLPAVSPATATVVLCGLSLSVPEDAAVQACKTKAGVFDGPFVVRNADGSTQASGVCRGGRAEGTLTTWHANQRKQRETTYSGGLRDGPWTLWAEDGNRRITATFRRGRLHGVSTSWFSDGGKADERGFRDGKPHGVWKSWHRGGRLASKRAFRDGLVHGRVTRWHANGRKQEQSRWVDGKVQGVVARWDRLGKRWPAGAQSGTESQIDGSETSAETGNTANGGSPSGKVPLSADELVKASIVAVRQGDSRRSRLLCQKALDLEPRNHQAASVCVLASCKLGKRDEATRYLILLPGSRQRSWFRGLCKKEGVVFEAFELQKAATRALSAGRFADAEHACEAALDLAPDSQDSLATCALADCNLKYEPGARKYFAMLRGKEHIDLVRRTCLQQNIDLDSPVADGAVSDDDVREAVE